jgi:hypothetical protein
MKRKGNEGMQFSQSVRGHGGHGVWVRRVEHFVLRVVSLGFSLASAHAIRWFFAPLDGVDALQPVITWTVAAGFGILGYIVSRGLAHRLMNKERIRAYAPICLVVEVVEIFCNYALAAAVIQRATWLQEVPVMQRTFLTDFTYLVLSIIPLVSVLLAVVDMDLERSKLQGAFGGGVGRPILGNGRGPSFASPAMPPLRFQPQSHAQPKDASFGSLPGVAGVASSFPAYSQGYGGNAPVMAAGAGALPPQPAPQQQAVPQQQGGILNGIPFLGKRQVPAPAPTVALPSTQ